MLLIAFINFNYYLILYILYIIQKRRYVICLCMFLIFYLKKIIKRVRKKSYKKNKRDKKDEENSEVFLMLGGNEYM